MNAEHMDMRMEKVMSAREAIGCGAYDTPGIFDAALDGLIDRAISETEMEAARQAAMDDEFQRMTESDR